MRGGGVRARVGVWAGGIERARNSVLGGGSEEG